MPHKKMGEILLEKKIISQENLDKALEQQKSVKKPIGQILEQMDVVLEEDIAQALSTQFGFPLVKRFAQHKFSADILKLIDPETAISKMVFPLKLDKKTLYLAMANPLDMTLQSDMSFKLGLRVSPCVSTPGEITRAIKKHYLVKDQLLAKSAVKTILLINQYDLEASTIEAALQKEGFEVVRTSSGSEGLTLATQIVPDLILTETVLPRMNGEQLYSSLKSNTILFKIPIIALSSKATPEEEVRLLDMGFEDFVSKPLNMPRLVARIRKALR